MDQLFRLGKNDHLGMDQVLATLGVGLQVDRLCIFANTTMPQAPEQLLLTPCWQWFAPETVVEMGRAPYVSRTYQGGLERWQEQLGQGQMLEGLMADLPELEQDYLKSHQVRSLLVGPIQMADRFWGAIILEDCQIDRLWSNPEKTCLQTVTTALGGLLAQGQFTLTQFNLTQGSIQDSQDATPATPTAALTSLQNRDLGAADPAAGSTLNPEDIQAAEISRLWQVIEELERAAVKYEEVESILRKSESRFQKLAANAPGMLYQFRLAPDGAMSFPYASSGCWDMFGYQPGELRRDGTLLTDSVHSEDQEYFLASMHYSAETIRDWEWEGRMVTATGEVKWIQGRSRPERQPDGSVVWDGLLMDVSDRKAAEAKIRESYNLLNSVVNGTSDHILVKDQTGQYILVNDALLETFGISADALIGKDDWAIFPSDEAQKIIKIDQAIMDQRESRTFEETIIVKGKTRTFLTTKTPITMAMGSWRA
jgi:PAS domain S-box-containing protein